MKLPLPFFLTGALSLVAALALSTTHATARDYQLKLLSTGADDLLGGFATHEVALSTNQPAGITHAPASLFAPLFGKVTLGSRESLGTYYFIVDQPPGQPQHLYVDANGDGNVGQDPVSGWVAESTLNEQDGRHYTNYSGSPVFKVHYGTNIAELGLSADLFDRNDPRRAQFKDVFLYDADYMRTGQVTLGWKTYPALLADTSGTGEFRPETATTNKPTTVLYLDVNGDGKFARHGEAFSPGVPFNLRGTSYVLTNLTASGDHFQIVKSAVKVPETKPLPVLIAGHPMLKFTATNTTGEPVKFPQAYKHKVVLLDFWATWCGPCRAQVPYIVAAYNQFHDRGFEVLGVSLDRTNAAGRVAAFTKDHGMAWPQIYEGRYWQVSLASLYNIDSIPHAFLVDGGTGRILAEGEDVEGDKLGAALAKVLGPSTTAMQSAR